MNRKILALTLGVCIFATGCSAVSQRDYDALAKENSRLQEANEKLESEISALKDSENEAESSVAASVPASAAEAAYGADNCGADWYEQAANKAADYLSFMSFSKSQLIEQLEFEGFTSAQAEYGAKAVGY